MDLSTLGRFHIAPGYDPAQPSTWVWTDRSQDVNHVNGGVTITGGRGDETTEVEAGGALLEVDNAGGHYCDANPNGRWYGLLTTGCPARWGTISGAEAWTDNTSNGWGTPDVGLSWSLDGTASDWSSSGGAGQVLMTAAPAFHQGELTGANARNGEATFVCAAPVVATGAALVCSLTARRTVGVSQILFSVDFGTGGTLGARIKRDVGGGLTDIGGTPTVGTYTAGQRIKVRCQWDGQDLRLRVWPEASGEPTTWSATATDTQCTGSAVAVHSWRVAGNSNAGNLTFSYDDLEIEAVEIVGTLPDLPIRWDPTATVSWAPLEIAGITRRLSQGEDQIESPIHRQLMGQNPQGYWPLEDDSGATLAASAVPRGQPATLTGATLGGTDCPAGALAAATLTTALTSKITGRVLKWQVPYDGYAGMFYFRCPNTLPGSGVPLMEITAAGTIARWVVSLSNAQFTIVGYLADGSVSISPAGAVWTGSIDPTKWVALQLEAQEIGGNVTWTVIYHQVGSTGFFVAGTGSFAGTADRLNTITGWAPSDGALISHMWAGDDLLPFVDVTFMQVSAAFPGETDTARIARLFGEKAVRIAVEPGTGEQLGPQKIQGLLPNVREAEAAGLGVLYETGSGYGYRPRSARYNRPADMALAIAPTGDIADEPQPGRPDQYVRNFWKVTRDGGSSATDQDDAHIVQYGRRPDTATINVFSDGVLPDNASWRVHLGTWGEYRWPQLVIDFTDRPAQLAAWRGRPFAPRITVSGVPSQGPIGQDLSLIVEGFRQEITSASWQVTLNCSPARPWDVGVYGTSKAGSSSTTTVSTLTAGPGSGQSLTLTFAIPQDAWSTAGVPYPIRVKGGEVMTVTAMGAVTGSAPNFQQVATVTRAVNGISPAHAAGEDVQIYTAPVYAL
jgi:hypothetical protein